MSFEKKKLPSSESYSRPNTSHTYTRRRSYVRNRGSLKWAEFFRKAMLYCIIGFLAFIFLGGIIIYIKYIKDLPSISELENLEIAQASTIYDRDGNELYSIFKEKRTYIWYENISQNMVHAIVAWEDKRFFENPGVDIIGLFRAVLYRVIGKSDSLWGTSTLTQQLIRNTIIENRSSSESFSSAVGRKIKEIYLAYKLTSGVSKEKILELYLNKISYWSNAFGIEQASRTFFGKHAKELDVLEASVLASLPKGPTYYSPYNNYDRLMGYPYFYPKVTGGSDNTISVYTPEEEEKNRDITDEFKRFIKNLDLKRLSDSKAVICGIPEEKVKNHINVDSDGCSVLEYSNLLTLLNAVHIESGENIIEYQTGRKDFILGRMLEDNYITFDEYKVALVNSVGFPFEKYTEEIKYPHFVFYVRDYLEKKYGKDVLEKGGFQIYTTIDPILQDKAEEIVKKYADANAAKSGAKNAALISIDNKTGEILTMVWGKDYFDTESKGNVNIITSRLQPGSSFKPFVYSIAIDKEIIGTKTPIYDVKTDFPGGYTPKNFDGKFMGKMTVTMALNYSRNIPAIKMFFLAWGEEVIIDWMAKLWVSSLQEFKDEYKTTYGKEYNYGASMALGTWLMTPLELASAYSVYANMGVKKNIVPILKILDGKGNIIEEFKPEENTGEQVFDPSVAFITNYMLSDTSARPSTWNNYISLPGRTVAAKTGTSTKQYTDKSGEKIILPRNLWTIGYTPQVTTVVWAWNTNGDAVGMNGDGLQSAGPIWRDFMKFYHSDEPVENWKRPSGVKEINVSKISGLLIPEWFPENLIVGSLFKNIPKSFDRLGKVTVDILCNGKITDSTPKAAIQEVNLVELHSLRPDNSAWEWPVQAWIRGGGFKEELWELGNFITYVQSEACERPDFVSWNIALSSSISDGEEFVYGENYIELEFKWISTLKKIDVLLDDTLIQEILIEEWDSSWTYKWKIIIPKTINAGQKILTVRAVDTNYYSSEQNISISLSEKDNDKPSIILSDPKSESININTGENFNLVGEVEDRGTIRSINIYMDGKPLKIGIEGRVFDFPINTQDLSSGTHTIKIEAVDTSFNIGIKEININILWWDTLSGNQEDSIPE